MVEPQGGFSKHERPKVPVISGGVYGYEHVNAAVQRHYPQSLLNWTERIIRMRKEVPEIGWGNFTIIPSGQREVLIIRYDWRDNSVLFIHNFDATPREITFSLRLDADNAARRNLLINLLSEDHSRAGGDGRHRMVVEGYGYHWYRVGGLDYLLRRTESNLRIAPRKGARASVKSRL